MSVTTLAKIEHPVCAVCNGVDVGRCCCLVMPGICHPDDFNKPLGKTVWAKLISGLYSIDWWEGDLLNEDEKWGRTLYVRPATADKQGKMIDASWGGVCVFWRSGGCHLKYEDRPRGCNSLRPDPLLKTCHGDTKAEGALYWSKNQVVLHELENLARGGE